MTSIPKAFSSIQPFDILELSPSSLAMENPDEEKMTSVAHAVSSIPPRVSSLQPPFSPISGFQHSSISKAFVSDFHPPPRPVPVPVPVPLPPSSQSFPAAASTSGEMWNSRDIPDGSCFNSAISIDTDLLSRTMEGKAKILPLTLNKSAGSSSCCIFKVPRGLIEINKRAYEPHVVSIGPYHHRRGAPLEMIEARKWQFLSDLLSRTKKNLKDLIDPIAGLEKEIRESYSENLSYDGNQLIEIMVVDGCFIIELVRKVGRVVDYDPDEPLVRMPWMLPFIMRDLLSLENQIPYFVLETLFRVTVEDSRNGDKHPSFTELALKFFNYLMQRPESSLEKHYKLQGKHLLHLILLTYLPQHRQTYQVHQPLKYLQLIPSATKLRLSGVKFKSRISENGGLLEIKFVRGALEIPKLVIDDFSSSLVLNFVAFEQCYGHCPRHITHYCAFLGSLVGSPGDVALLTESNIIQNYLGTDEEVVCFFNNIRKEVVLDIKTSNLAEVFEGVNRYCDNQLHVKWAGFRHRYCDAPWTVMSVLAASLILLLTLTGTVITGLAYWRPPTKN